MPRLTTQLSDVSLQESVDSPPAGSRRSMWGGFSRGGKKVRSPPAYSSYSAYSFAKGDHHGEVDHDKMRKHSVALAHRISVHTSRLATERELAKAGCARCSPRTTRSGTDVGRCLTLTPIRPVLGLEHARAPGDHVPRHAVRDRVHGRPARDERRDTLLGQSVYHLHLSDMLMICLLPFEGEDGQWVVDKKVIFWRYLRSMFFIDLVSIAPFDIIERVHTANTGPEDGDIANLKAFRILKLFRLLKVLRIFRGLRIVRERECEYAIDYQALNISMLLVVL